MSSVEKNRFLFSTLFLVFLCASCKVHILSAKYVSMVTDELPKSVNIGQSVEEEWCIDEAPKNEELLLGPGYLDRVALKAHKKYNARYFADVSFFQEGTCAVMVGNVVK